MSENAGQTAQRKTERLFFLKRRPLIRITYMEAKKAESKHSTKNGALKQRGMTERQSSD